MGLDIHPPTLFVGVKMARKELFTETKIWSSCGHGAPKSAVYCPTCGLRCQWCTMLTPLANLPLRATYDDGKIVFLGDLQYLPQYDNEVLKYALIGLELKNEEPTDSVSRIDATPSAASFAAVSAAAEKVCSLLNTYGLGSKAREIKVWAITEISY